MSTKIIHVFSDYACPWCYLGLARLREATKDEDVDVVLLPFPLAALGGSGSPGRWPCWFLEASVFFGCLSADRFLAYILYMMPNHTSRLRSQAARQAMAGV